MSPVNFSLHQPQTLEEALDLVSLHRSSVAFLGGGTDLVIRLRSGICRFDHLVSLARVRGLKAVDYRADDGLVIGGAAKISEVGRHPDVRKHYPGLAHACSVMATVQIRNMGTVAGNICTSSPAGDTLAPLLAYGASLVCVERGGRRQVKLRDFFTGPGQNCLEPVELVEAIRVPAPPRRAGSCYRRIFARSKVDMAAVGVAAQVHLDMQGKFLGARVALGAVAPTPVRCLQAEEMLVGQSPEPEVLMRAAAACVRAAQPIDDVRATAAYRRRMVQVLAERVIAQSAELAQGGAQ